MKPADIQKLFDCIERLKKAGGQCANCCHNLSDYPGIDKAVQDSLRRAVQAYDNACDDYRSHLSSL